MSVIKVVEDAIYCQDCAGRISRRTPIEFAIRFPASSPKSKCHGASIEKRIYYIPLIDMIPIGGGCIPRLDIDHDNIKYHCKECRKPCESIEEKGTCRGCGKTVQLCEASKVVRREN